MINKIRVLHIITRLDAGGSATNTLETVSRLDPARFDVELICGVTDDPEGRIADFISQHRIHCVVIKDLVRAVHPLKDIPVVIRLYRMIKRGDYEIVHTHSSKAGILGRLAAHWAGVERIVHTPHGHVFYGYFPDILSSIFIIVERLVAPLTDVLIELTQKGVEEHLALGIGTAGQWAVAPSGIDLELFKPDVTRRSSIRKALAIADHEILIVSVGRLEPVKGQSCLIDALALILKTNGNVKLMLVGDGSESHKLQEKVKVMGLEGRVMFTGFRAETSVYYNAADIFALASLNEGMGRAVIEAMASARPVVLSRTGGMAELIEDGKEGFLCRAGDSADFARALLALAGDAALRSRMAENAFRRANAGFSVQGMVERLESIYERFYG